MDVRSNNGLTPHWKPKLIGLTGSNSSGPTFLTGFGDSADESSAERKRLRQVIEQSHDLLEALRCRVYRIVP